MTIIKKKSAKSSVKTFSVNLLNINSKDYEKITSKKKKNIKTDCKKFGKVILDSDFNFVNDDCKKCDSTVKQYCLKNSKYDKIKLPKLAKRSDNSAQYDSIFKMLADNMTSKDIQKLVIDQFSSDGACKSFVSTCSASFNAVKNPNGKSKMSAYARFLGSTAKNPKMKIDILPKSKRFTEKAFRFVQALEKNA